MTTDPVTQPDHYTASDSNSVEAIDAIRASMDPKEFQAYCRGNVLKYLWRYPRKGALTDLLKAQVYLGWLIESFQSDTTACSVNYSDISRHYGISTSDMQDLVENRCDDCE